MASVCAPLQCFVSANELSAKGAFDASIWLQQAILLQLDIHARDDIRCYQMLSVVSDITMAA